MISFFSQRYGNHRVTISETVIEGYILATVETRAGKWTFNVNIRECTPVRLRALISGQLAHVDEEPAPQAQINKFWSDWQAWVKENHGWPTNVLRFERKEEGK